MKVYIIDASVATKFLLVEDLSETRLPLRSFLDESVDISAPDLVLSEVGNALWKAVKRKSIELNEALEKLRYFHKLKINSVKLTERDYVEALSWAVKNDATYYDSIYVKAAEMAGTTLLAADDQFCEKASKAIATKHLRQLQS